LQFFADDAIWTKAFASSMLVGVVVAAVMTPFDTISTRLYNQSKKIKILLVKIFCFDRRSNLIF